MGTPLKHGSDACAPPATVAQVANEFLRLSDDEPEFGPIDPMKLQKLLFYAHAWHLAFGKGPLFENDFEAWPWGPVVRDVYAQTRQFGRGRVKAKIWEFRKGRAGFDIAIPDGVDDDLKPFIRSVWNALKAYSGIQLSNSTHATGEPWTIVARKLGTDSKPVIPNEIIEDVFRSKLDSYERADTSS